MRIGLVLSGGMAKGAYQVGVLKALRTVFPPTAIDLISAASIGVINGFAFASDRLEAAEDVWKRVATNGRRPWITSLLGSDLLQEWIREITGNGIPSLEGGAFFATLFHLGKRSVVYRNLREIAPEQLPLYLRASVAMPVYNEAVTIDGERFFDGAMVDNIPLYPLTRYPPDVILCVHFEGERCCFDSALDERMLHITFSEESVLARSVRFSEESTAHMLKTGYETAAANLNMVFGDDADPEQIYTRLQILRQRRGKGERYLSGDMAVRNLNRLVQRLIRKKIID